MSRWKWSQAVWFQLLWFSAIVGGNSWLGVCLLLLGLHFLVTPTRRHDFCVLLLAVIGIGVEMALLATGVYQFEAFPYWLLLLWSGFVLTLGHSLDWLRRVPLAACCLLGACAGLSSYYASWRLHAVAFPNGTLETLTTIAMIWSLILPLLVKLDRSVRGLL